MTAAYVLDPDLPICDAHFHVMNHSGFRATPSDYGDAVASGHWIVRSVFVESDPSYYRSDGPQYLRPLGEIEMARELSRVGQTEIAGIVGFVDLTAWHLTAEALEDATAAGRGRLKGIRHRLPQRWDSTMSSDGRDVAELYSDPAFRAGAAEVARCGLALDTWQYFHQLSWVTELARAVPELRIVINHVGGIIGVGPHLGRREEVFETWSKGLAQVATCANVYVKLGGLGMDPAGFGFRANDPAITADALADAWRPYLLTCIDKFGVERCMFESNFPVDSPSCDYRDLWNAFKIVASQGSSSEKAFLFHDTASQFYELDH